MFDRALDWLLRRVIRRGRLQVTWPDGTRLDYGAGDPRLRPVAARIHDAATVRALARNPDLALGEGYMDGRITIAGDDLPGLMALLLANRMEAPARFRIWRMTRLRRALRFVTQRNRPGRARRNVAHHYDLSGDLYELFLDADRQYSCAYFQRPDRRWTRRRRPRSTISPASWPCGRACRCWTSAAAGAAWRSRWRATMARGSPA